MKHSGCILVSLTLASLTLLPRCTSSRAYETLEDARLAYMKMDLDKSRTILDNIVVSPGASTEDRVEALQFLAEQDWLFYRDSSGAMGHLLRADSFQIKQSATWQLASRIEREAKDFPRAREAAKRALSLALGHSDSLNARMALARAVHDETVHNVEEGKTVDRRSLQEASGLLSSMLEDEPGRPVSSQLLFGISLFLGDGPTALRAWYSYFHILPEEPIPAPLRESGRILSTLLPTWKNRQLSDAELTQLAFALGQSRFFDYAVLFLKGRGAAAPASPEEQELLLYRDFLNRVREASEDFYRRTAVGGGKNGFFSSLSLYFREGSYHGSLEDIRRDFWTNVPRLREQGELNDTLLARELRGRFGLEWWIGNQNNYYGLLAGHRVFDTTDTISQYGFRANVRYVSVDMMVSNGYSSWFWDGRAMIGGTASESTVYQFRPGYVDEPFDLWQMVTDRVRREETEKKILEGRRAEDSVANLKPYASLPGLSLRLRYAGANRILSRLRERGLSGPDLCLAFVSEFDRLAIAATIFAHEGRHLIDKQHYGAAYGDSLSPADQEYDAKMSEVTFSPDPKFSFGHLISRYAGDPSPHGQAEERLMKLVLRWMDDHRKEIAGFDPARPTLPQFDLLTDDQVRALLRQADPLARKSSG